ncbi:hypothetical protein A3K72_00720 [Candidatus Woesearchaeota archaeon RBG_13_36_6]|nr:MAG: hypothetical protein A3K72_00720 [Candidatus Woesearchaeota archaeon RBG_13_36_6]
MKLEELKELESRLEDFGGKLIVTPVTVCACQLGRKGALKFLEFLKGKGFTQKDYSVSSTGGDKFDIWLFLRDK